MQRRTFNKLLGAAVLANALLPFKRVNASNATDTSSANSNPQVWYITAASGGLGFALAQYLLEKGEKVAGTSRSLKNIQDKLGKESENFLPLELKFDKNMAKNIAANLKAVERKFGRLDNVVNNAGYALMGFVEEVSEKQLREQFEVNVFAPFLIAQNALAIMRPQALRENGNAQNIKARIYNISSIRGFSVANGSTPYSMSKFAVSALSEGLSLDTAEFGIAVVNVMPTQFRTEFAGSSMNLGELENPAYAARRKAYIERTSAYNGKQAGNPAAFAKVIFETSRQSKPPFYLFMGENAYKAARDKIALVQSDMKATERYAGAAVDFADAGESIFDQR